MKDLLLFGIQCSGKGTQAKLLDGAMPEHFSYFSSGDLFRALTKGGDNAIGHYVKNRIESGALIDDAVTNHLFAAYMATVIDDQKYMLLDGYPRTVAQLDDIMRLAKEHGRALMGIHFKLDDALVYERMASRGRSDDTPEAMKHRIAQFYEKTMPVIEHFEKHGELVTIDASQGIEEIAKEVLEVYGV